MTLRDEVNEGCKHRMVDDGMCQWCSEAAIARERAQADARVAAEREACAGTVDRFPLGLSWSDDQVRVARVLKAHVAAVIRASKP